MFSGPLQQETRTESKQEEYVNSAVVFNIESMEVGDDL